MERLRASDVETPWGVWTDISYVTLHNASTWIWQAGGDFLSADGRRILLNRPEALNGLLAYLGLHRYVSPDFKYVLGGGAHGYELFTSRRVAVAMGPNGWFGGIEQSHGAEVLDRLGVAAPPGPAFIGGSNLVVWQHTHHTRDAYALVRFLASKQGQLEHCRLTGFLPTRLDVFSEPPYSTKPQYQVMAEALRTGRSYPTIRKWGAVEERLAAALVWLWNDILADPDQDLEALVKPYIEGIARRLAITLKTRL
jgi:ABC-type glycerol-3-phosphate transport system substrate-binding protein